MREMFENAYAFDQAIGSWNVSSVEDMTAMFFQVELSVSNYNDLLTGWESQSVQDGVVFHGGYSEFSAEASLARQRLIDDHNWTITDGGQAQ